MTMVSCGSDRLQDFGEVVSVSIEGQNAIVKMSKRQEAEFAVHKGSVINEHRATVKWYIEPAQETGYGESEEEGEDAGEGENEEAEAEAVCILTFTKLTELAGCGGACSRSRGGMVPR